jgi:hypothetical protein
MKKKIIRSLKSNLFSQLRCLDYFPHMSVFHQERTGFDHHWTRILCVYWAGACPFDLVASFKVGDHKSNVKSVERRGIKIKMTCNSQSLLIDTPVRAKLKSVTAEVLYTPISFGGGINILSKMNKKIYISCKSTFFLPFDLLS